MMRKQKILKPSLILGAVLAVAGSQAWAHGFLSFPASRAKMCQSENTGCGSVQYEPQSVEGSDGWPNAGPADGTIAAAGLAQFSALNEQTATRWYKHPMQSGPNKFTWSYTAPHRSKDIRYYITKANWDANRPLSRASFDTTPFCVIDGGNAVPPREVSHTCNVPERSGYHVILSAWDVADTAATFYNVMDAQFGPATSSTTISNTTPNIAAVSSLKAVGDINPSLDLKVGDQVYTRVFTASGEQQSLRTTLVIDSVANGAKDRWPYLLAQKVNAERGTMLAAGTLGSDGSVTPAPGRNTVYAKTTGIVSVETTIDQVQAATNPAAAPGFVLTDVPKDLLLDSAGNRSIAVAGKTSVAGAKVVAQLLDSNNAVRAVATRDMPEAGEFVLNLAVTGAKAGTHSLVVTATNMADPSKVTQQTVSVTLRSPQTANAPASTAASGAQYAFPNGLASYVAGTKVSHKGKVFTCKPFPYSGYCRQWSASANGFEPGVGHAWSMAWTQD